MAEYYYQEAINSYTGAVRTQGIDYTLQDDGVGVYVKSWNITGYTQPTIAQLQTISNGLTITRLSVTDIIATNTSSVAVIKNTYQKLTFPTVSLDVNSEFSANTFTSKSVQTVHVSAYSYLTGSSSSIASLTLCIYKNGTLLYTVTGGTYCTNPFTTGTLPCQISYPIDVVVGDTLMIYAYQTDTATSRNTGGKELLTIRGI